MNGRFLDHWERPDTIVLDSRSETKTERLLALYEGILRDVMRIIHRQIELIMEGSALIRRERIHTITMIRNVMNPRERLPQLDLSRSLPENEDIELPPEALGEDPSSTEPARVQAEPLRPHPTVAALKPARTEEPSHVLAA